ncbi:hypothetical protein FRB99_004285, partial [Tulasnella sp. 403]
HALEDLQRTRKPVIAFWGDAYSGVRDVVTALLEEPLSDDQVRRNALVGRHDAHPGSHQPLRITFSEENKRDGGTLKLNASWLRNAQADILEITGGNLDDSLQYLLTADHIILVSDNVRFLTQPHLSTIAQVFSNHPSASILLNRIHTSANPVQDETHLATELGRLFQHRISPSSSTIDPPSLHIRMVSSNDALESLDIFRSNQSPSASARAATLDLYQAKHKASGISGLSSHFLSSLLKSARSELALKDEDLLLTQARTGLFLVSCVLDASQEGIDSATSEVLAAEKRVQSLRSRAEGDVNTLKTEFTVSPAGVSEEQRRKVPPGDNWAVHHSVESSAEHVRAILNRYQWWNLPWRVDDLGTDMRDVVVDHYAAELEQRILFLTGKLASLQEKLSGLSIETINHPPNSPFHSPILHNTLAQHDRVQPLPPSLLSMSTPLLQPLTTRRKQLLDHLIPQLHARAQGVVSTLYLASFGSAGAAWATWITESTSWMTGDIAVGFAALGVAGAVRLSMSRLDKAKRRFWEGWGRVREGLSRDTEAALDEIVVKQVTAKSEVAREGLSSLITQRKKDIDDVKAELLALRSSLESLRARLP